jgi:hypothetical protein
MKRSNWVMQEFSLVGEHEHSTNWVLCTRQKKGSESRIWIKRHCEDGSQQRKKICCEIVQCDGPQAKYGSPDTDLETHMEFCLPACDNPDSEFNLECFMNILPPEGGDLPLVTLEDFWDGDISTLFA